MRPALVIAALCAVIAGCGSGSSSDSSSSGSSSKPTGSAAASGAVKTDKVSISDFKYQPATVEIKAGTKVTFSNRDSATHTATSKQQGAFDSGDIAQGKTKVVTFKKPGTFKYYCVFHAFMHGTVKVD